MSCWHWPRRHGRNGITIYRHDIFSAIYYRDYPSLERILQDPRAVVNGEICCAHNTPLFMAVMMQDVQMLRMLLQHPLIQVNCCDDRGMTALMLAAHNGWTLMLELLLTHHDIQINMMDFHQVPLTALMYAVVKNHYLGVQHLLQRPDLNINQRTTTGQTAFYTAVQCRHVQIIHLLLTHGAIDIHVADTTGLTPLHVAHQADMAFPYLGKRLQQALNLKSVFWQAHQPCPHLVAVWVSGVLQCSTGGATLWSSLPWELVLLTLHHVTFLY